MVRLTMILTSRPFIIEFRLAPLFAQLRVFKLKDESGIKGLMQGRDITNAVV